MNKEIFEKRFMENLNKNFPNLSKYFDCKLIVFNELDTIIFEINKCLILEFYRAAITLTNHLLERLLKLALIYNEAGIGPKPVEQWNSAFEGPHKKYSSLILGNSIEKCKEQNLISENERNYLFNTIRELMRNGFSHADSSRILANLSEDSIAFQGNLKNPTEIKEVSLNQKVIPFLEGENMAIFARENALCYFEFVIALILQIEKRLNETKIGQSSTAT